MPTKIAIVGAGQVGSVTAYSLLRGSYFDELVLIDLDSAKRDGHVRDLMDAAGAENSTTQVVSGTHRDAGRCEMIILATGVKRRRGEQFLFRSGL
jgi:L-lactate dehydrogenase